ncbi:hypothetical protein SNE40_008188 [Patella caerulea]|uniref:Uncharacterized protein n=1 Tax=Patella caerulea TaxID=87958 RepID=A0AAN8K678_PATCE
MIIFISYFQLQKCQELYERLRLDSTNNKQLFTSPFPKIQMRERTFLSLNLLPKRKKSGELPNDVDTISQKTTSSENIHRMDTDRRYCVRMTPAKLCEYLRSKGLGQPRVFTSSYVKRENETIIKPHPRPFFNLLSKNRPRKTKGHIRFNYEKDNTRVATNVDELLRSASQEDLSNHQIQRGNNSSLPKRDSKGRSENSLDGLQAALTKEERFKRIEAWLENVNNAQKEISDSESDLQANCVTLNLSSARLNDTSSEVNSVFL